MDDDLRRLASGLIYDKDHARSCLARGVLRLLEERDEARRQHNADIFLRVEAKNSAVELEVLRKNNDELRRWRDAAEAALGAVHARLVDQDRHDEAKVVGDVDDEITYRLRLAAPGSAIAGDEPDAVGSET